MPIFGLTTIGGSGNSDIGATMFGYKVTSPSTDITNAYIRSITIYGTSESAGGTVVWGLYTDNGSGTGPDTKILYNTAGNTYVGGINAWQTTTQPFIAAVNSKTAETFPTALSGSTTYWLVDLSNSSTTNCLRSRYNNIAGTYKAYNSTYTYTNYPTLPADFGVNDYGAGGRNVSVYVTYYVAETSTILSNATIVSAGGNIHDRTRQVFDFVDSTNNDFHLANTDTSAFDKGVDLSADSIYPFSTDIDGDTRTYWSIGADDGTQATTTITSDATIDAETLTATILSNSQITRETIYSAAEILGSETITINSNAFVRVDILSDAEIILTLSTIDSNAYIVSSVTDTITTTFTTYDLVTTSINSNAFVRVDILSDAEVSYGTTLALIYSAASVYITDTTAVYSDTFISHDILSDSHIWGVDTTTVYSDATVWDTESVTIGTDSFISESITSDSHITVVDTKTIESDAFIETTINSDGHIKVTDTETSYSDSHIWDTYTENVNSNGHITISDSTTIESDVFIATTVLSDCEIGTGTVTTTIGSDAFIELTIGSDAFIATEILSSATVWDTYTENVNSNGHITVPDSTTIESDVFIATTISSNAFIAIDVIPSNATVYKTGTISIISNALVTTFFAVSIRSNSWIFVRDTATVLINAEVSKETILSSAVVSRFGKRPARIHPYQKKKIIIASTEGFAKVPSIF